MIQNNFGIACKLVTYIGCPVVRNGCARWFGMAVSAGSEWLCDIIQISINFVGDVFLS